MVPPRSRRRLHAEINITPFTDVVLVILIIFMVATPMIYKNQIKVQLPSTKTRVVDEHPRKLEIRITAQGEPFLDGIPYAATNEASWSALRSALAAASGGEGTLVIHGDKAVPYGAVVQVIDLARSVELRRIVLATDRTR